MATTTYTITKRNGEVIQFATALSVDDAAGIVGGLPLTEFSGSLMLAYRRGALSPAQELWLLKLAHDATAPKAAGPYLPLVETVTAMQSRAKGRVQLRLREKITLKSVTRGNNAGALYLYRGGEYAGKITPEGTCYSPIHPEIQPVLTEATADPVAAAQAYGRDTGSCACCGRTLTDPVSIWAAIGPVCLERLAGPEARKQAEREYRLAAQAA
jgi:hypothetical protein